MRMEVSLNGRAVPSSQAPALLVAVSRSFRERQEQSRVQRRVARLDSAPDRRSVAHAMLMVEIRLVKAFWTIARQPAKGAAPGGSSSCGIPYLHDRSDVDARYTDAAGGKWEAPPPRPALPSSKDIDQANEALDWLLHVDEPRRKILVIGATSKRGDAGRRINWMRLRSGLPDYAGMTVRTLQRRYSEALRIIVTEMTIAQLSRVSHK